MVSRKLCSNEFLDKHYEALDERYQIEEMSEELSFQEFVDREYAKYEECYEESMIDNYLDFEGWDYDYWV
jgi:hypothetical protein